MRIAILLLYGKLILYLAFNVIENYHSVKAIKKENMKDRLN